MGFTVDLLNNQSPVEMVDKTLDTGITISDVVLKRDTSILKPILHVATDADIIGYNYMYISSFNRYYFIDDIVSVGNERWEISAHVDVLQTYKDQILEQIAVIKRQQSKYNTYLNDPEWKVYAYEQRWAKKFPTAGFNKALHFILTTAGA